MNLIGNKTVAKLAGAAAGLAMAGAALLGAGAREASAGPLPCLLKADIIMERAQLQKQGNQTQVRLAFRNGGCNMKSGFWSTVLVDSTTYHIYTPAMANFETVVRLVNVAPVAPGQHILHVALDWHSGTLTSSVTESNEYNNFFWEMVTVP